MSSWSMERLPDCQNRFETQRWNRNVALWRGYDECVLCDGFTDIIQIAIGLLIGNNGKQNLVGDYIPLHNYFSCPANIRLQLDQCNTSNPTPARFDVPARILSIILQNNKFNRHSQERTVRLHNVPQPHIYFRPYIFKLISINSTLRQLYLKGSHTNELMSDFVNGIGSLIILIGTVSLFFEKMLLCM